MPIVIASSFADPADIAAYKKAIAEGKSEKEALALGDNGIGCWGDDTTSERRPMCALPPEDGNRTRSKLRGMECWQRKKSRRRLMRLQE